MSGRDDDDEDEEDSDLEVYIEGTSFYHAIDQEANTILQKKRILMLR